MIKIALVAEGYGDATAIPNLIARSAAMFGEPAIVSEPVIRAGEYGKLRRTGELERWLELACTKVDCEHVLVVCDLEDACPKEVVHDFRLRAEPFVERFNKRIDFVFCVREYQSWFLSQLDHIIKCTPYISWKAEDYDGDYLAKRGAKECISKAIERGTYKETRDQLAFTRHLDLKRLFKTDRSFRRFVRGLTGRKYSELETTTDQIYIQDVISHEVLRGLA